jgi:hypothetical protein
MRRLAEITRIRRLMEALGAAATGEARVYLTGGASAVLLGWRETTIDVDLALDTDRDELLRALPRLKEELELNIELAAPSHFVPELPGWQERSLFIVREGRVSFHHYDFYAQALAKIERGHVQDRADVQSMLRSGLVRPPKLRELFDAVRPQLYRYPAIDPSAFEQSLDQALAG